MQTKMNENKNPDLRPVTPYDLLLCYDLWTDILPVKGWLNIVGALRITLSSPYAKNHAIFGMVVPTYLEANLSEKKEFGNTQAINI